MTHSQAADVSKIFERSFSSEMLILCENELGPEYFRLESGLLGELLQKFVNYDRKVALIVADESFYGERVRELIWEHRSHSHSRFFRTREEAEDWAPKCAKEQA